MDQLSCCYAWRHQKQVYGVKEISFPNKYFIPSHPIWLRFLIHCCVSFHCFEILCKKPGKALVVWQRCVSWSERNEKELNLFMYFLPYSQATTALKCCQTFREHCGWRNSLVLNISQSQSGSSWWSQIWLAQFNRRDWKVPRVSPLSPLLFFLSRDCDPGYEIVWTSYESWSWCHCQEIQYSRVSHFTFHTVIWGALNHLSLLFCKSV